MEYFNLLEFNKEPFSNSPEPEFLFASPQHNTCLQRLELAIRLRRGLNIVIGAVGTGKTTLCRKLIQNLSMPSASDTPVIETYLLLDPAVAGQLEFVKTVASILGIADISSDDHEWQIKERIKNFLFEQGVQEQKNIVLIIDEGQKIPDDCLEILREFLNYETNSFKLLQIIIFAQPEFRRNLAARMNLLDRVNYLYHLQPLSFLQTKAMIEYRISIASQDPSRQPLLTFGGMLAVYCATMGYPRKVVSLCHQVLLMMIIRGKSRAGWFLVRNCINKMTLSGFKRVTWATSILLISAVLLIASVVYLNDPAKTGSHGPNHRVLAGIDIKKEDVNPHAERHSGEVSTEPDGFKAAERIPGSLGTIALKKRMTIWRVLENIYGDTGREIAGRFVETNPQIKNINNTLPGTVIQIPSMPDKAQPLNQDTIVVSLEKSNDLENTYYAFLEKKDREHMPPLLFFSFWNKREGCQFSIILDKRFKNIEEARESIRRLPLELATSAQILSQWEGDTVFFNSRLIR
ncbi:MAG: AAA family ATPase [Deltaproteobacteria bacterium]